MTPPTENRRRFSRINFVTKVELRDRHKHCELTLRDISLNGILLVKPSDWPFADSPQLEARIFLSDEDAIRMKVKLCHEEASLLGYQCIGIDMDSISHLRRLIELNLGDASIAERELADLL